MSLRLAVVVFCLLVASHVVQGSGAPAAGNALRQADVASIEKFHKTSTI